MSEGLEFQVGFIEVPDALTGMDIWKFLVQCERDVLRLYANHGSSLSSRQVAMKHKLTEDQILGGGIMTYCEGDMGFEGFSFAWGPAPDSVMRVFAPLVKTFLDSSGKYQVDSWRIAMHKPRRVEYDLALSTRIQKWYELGYKF
jgi:hypothetical protein